MASRTARKGNRKGARRILKKITTCVLKKITNKDNMNQQCKVCGEPAAGFHFGAFTCEGCKSFFGRSYNNLSTVAECKNGGECVINKKNRTACKACRLKKCIHVGMSKSGSRYGRRSNWFKIHCLLQQQQQQQLEQQIQQQQQQQKHYQPAIIMSHQQSKPTSPPMHGIHVSQSKDEAMMLSLDDYKSSNSPCVSSPESHNSDSSVEVSEKRVAFVGHPNFRQLHPHLQLQQPVADLAVLGKEIMGLPVGFPLSNMSLLPQAFLSSSALTMFPSYSHMYGLHHGAPHPFMATHSSSMLQCLPPPTNDESDGLASAATSSMTTTTVATSALKSSVTSVDDENLRERNNNDQFCLDADLKSERMLERTSTPKEIRSCSENRTPRCSPEQEIICPPPQDNPIDLSMKSATMSESDLQDDEIDMSTESDSVSDIDNSSAKKPIDLTTRT